MLNSLNTKMKDETIVKYIEGELGEEEKRRVMEWIFSTQENQERYNLLKAKHTASGFNIPVLDTEQAYLRVKEAGRNKKLRQVLIRVTSVAAILALGLLIFNVLNSRGSGSALPGTAETELVEEITPKGVSREIELPDGTQVVLNVDSQLRYSRSFTDSIREVFLSGEAYFEVQRDTTRPFIVHAGEMNVKVLGTSFNVRSYSEDTDVRTTLVEGVVEVGSAYAAPVKLEPLQAAMLNREEKHLKIKKVSREEAVSWKEGKLIFMETPLEEVLEDLERKYDVNFKVQSEALYEYLYTGTFDNLTIEEVLKVLQISSPIDYKKEENKITLY